MTRRNQICISASMTAVGALLWFGRADHFADVELFGRRIFLPFAHLFLGIGSGVLARETILFRFKGKLVRK